MIVTLAFPVLKLTVWSGAELLKVPDEKDKPVPTVTLLKPPEPFPYKIEVPEVCGA